MVYLDIMQGDRFLFQLPYEYCPLFPLNAREVADYVFSRRPSLKGKQNITIAFSGNRVYASTMPKASLRTKSNPVGASVPYGATSPRPPLTPTL